jgi:hypothetical protein
MVAIPEPACDMRVAKAAQSLLDIGGVAHLAEFADTDNGDTSFHLPAHGVVDFVLHQGIERLQVDILVVVEGEQHVRQLVAAGQAADVGGRDGQSGHVESLVGVNRVIRAQRPVGSTQGDKTEGMFRDGFRSLDC